MLRNFVEQVGILTRRFSATPFDFSTSSDRVPLLIDTSPTEGKDRPVDRKQARPGRVSQTHFQVWPRRSVAGGQVLETQNRRRANTLPIPILRRKFFFKKTPYYSPFDHADDPFFLSFLRLIPSLSAPPTLSHPPCPPGARRKYTAASLFAQFSLDELIKVAKAVVGLLKVPTWLKEWSIISLTDKR